MIENCTKVKKNNERKREKENSGVNNLLQIANVWSAKINSMFWLSASSGDPKVSIFVTRFMFTLIDAVYPEQWNKYLMLQLVKVLVPIKFTSHFYKDQIPTNY